MSRRVLSLFLLVACLSTLLAFPGWASEDDPLPGTITTVAGNGTAGPGYYDEGGPATSASINNAEGVAVDSAGNIYIADTQNNRVRKVDTDGIITNFAGNFYGINGYQGDGGPANSANPSTWGGAMLYYPGAVAVDSADNVYIVDRENYRIRKVDSAGTITTVAGNGLTGYSGDGGPATSAKINWATDVEVDSAGNIYIADTDNYRIRKVDSAGTITTVAGNGTWGYSGDGGPATSAKLGRPFGVEVDSAGNIYIADADNHRIRKVDSAGTITTVAGNGMPGPPGGPGYSGDGGPATSAKLYYPLSVAVDSAGNIYFVSGYHIRKVDSGGTITTVAGDGTSGYSGDGGPAIAAKLRPRGVEVDSAGNIYIVDTENQRIRKVQVERADTPLPPTDRLSKGVTLVGEMQISPETRSPQLTGSPAVVTADLGPCEDGAYGSGYGVIFKVAGANPTVEEVPVSSDGKASLEYTGTNPGIDQITATLYSTAMPEECGAAVGESATLNYGWQTIDPTTGCPVGPPPWYAEDLPDTIPGGCFAAFAGGALILDNGVGVMVPVPGEGVTVHADYQTLRVEVSVDGTILVIDAGDEVAPLPNPALPAAPSNLTATGGSSTQIPLSWTDNSTTEDGFEIERASSAAGPYSKINTVASGTTSYADTTVASSATYYYRVRAYNAAGASAYSNIAGASTGAAPPPPSPPPSPPTAPSSLSASAPDHTKVDLSWTDNSTNEAGFSLERSTNADGPFSEIVTLAQNTVSYTDSSVAANSVYHYRIRAFSTAGNSSYSNQASSTTPKTPSSPPPPPAAPSSPSGLSATARSASQIDLGWTDNSSNEYGFLIERRLSGGSWGSVTTVGQNSTGYADHGLQASTTYYYRVTAYGAGGSSSASGEANATTSAPPPPPDDPDVNDIDTETGQAGTGGCKDEYYKLTASLYGGFHRLEGDLTWRYRNSTQPDYLDQSRVVDRFKDANSHMLRGYTGCRGSWTTDPVPNSHDLIYGGTTDAPGDFDYYTDQNGKEQFVCGKISGSNPDIRTHDGKSVIEFGRVKDSAGAECTWDQQNDGPDKIIESDIRMDKNPYGPDTAYKWFDTKEKPDNCASQYKQYDLEGAVTHERGHSLGLGDIYGSEGTDHPGLTMGSASYVCSKQMRTLGKGDVLGLKDLYSK